MSDRRLPYIFTPAALTLLACLLFGVPREAVEPVVEEVAATQEQVAAIEATHVMATEVAVLPELIFSPGVDYNWYRLRDEYDFFWDTLHGAVHARVENCSDPCTILWDLELDPYYLEDTAYVLDAEYCAASMTDLRGALENLTLSFRYGIGSYFDDYTPVPQYLTVEEVKERYDDACYTLSTAIEGLVEGRRYYFEVEWNWQAAHTSTDGVTQRSGIYTERFIVTVGQYDLALDIMDLPVTQTKTISVGEQATARSGGEEETHDWIFQGQADEWVTIRVEGISADDPLFIFIDLNGAVLQTVWDSGECFDENEGVYRQGCELYAELTYFLPQTGTYTVKVNVIEPGEYSILLD